ncbi:hypothetical protein DAPPUDRAFT_54566 [Daphnia pulex]|uniref:Fatty acyl-CoA reductase n=1 Tax=Daphnia pulex TaxID=6669 RepID=E9GTL5_DAPPU|nr:hypothetical protein DAPPUDRAFT_54566 [Daphnia pulex]|eukprot:EFX77101.1 hypothetical protein DAPPUDRAFT_54566 [Daphnia pulex]
MADSNIVQFYEDRSIFITGATGFMGKVLVEKLLRSCPGINRLYVLMRPSKGKEVAVRLQELISNEVFDSLRREQSNMLEKIVALSGDVTRENFGLSPSDLNLIIENVSIVFNLAATVRFDEELKSALQMNVKGPMYLLEICRKMKNLDAFVHVSTAFSFVDRQEIDEAIYPSNMDPVKLSEFIDVFVESLMQILQLRLVGSYPNTYTYTKQLAEQILEQECGAVPLAIVRPSIVTAALKEPFPGWIDNLNGPTGLIAGGGKGFIRVFKVENAEFVTDLIPVDLSINLMIAVAWRTAIYKPVNPEVYFSSTSCDNPITFGEFESFTTLAWRKYPTKDMLWYPTSECTNKNWYYQLNVMLCHIMPAVIADCYARCVGQRANKVRIQNSKAFRALSAFDFFFSKQWKFISKNSDGIWSKMSAKDRQIFYFNVRDINWRAYFETYILGTRRFILKDDISTLPEAKKNVAKYRNQQLFLKLFVS